MAERREGEGSAHRVLLLSASAVSYTPEVRGAYASRSNTGGLAPGGAPSGIARSGIQQAALPPMEWASITSQVSISRLLHPVKEEQLKLGWFNLLLEGGRSWIPWQHEKGPAGDHPLPHRRARPSRSLF